MNMYFSLVSTIDLHRPTQTNTHTHTHGHTCGMARLPINAMDA